MFLGVSRYSNRGRECLVFKYPDSPGSCNVFLKMKYADGSVVASCIRCIGIYRRLPEEQKAEHQKPASLPVVNDTNFGSDPSLATHLPGCEPSRFQTVMERFDAAAEQPPSQSPLTSTQSQTSSAPVVMAEDGESSVKKDGDELSETNTTVTAAPQSPSSAASGQSGLPSVDEPCEPTTKIVVHVRSEANTTATAAPKSPSSGTSCLPYVDEAPEPTSTKDEEIRLEVASTIVAPQFKSSVTADNSPSSGVNGVRESSVKKEDDIGANTTTLGETTANYPVDICMSAVNPKQPIFVYKLENDSGNSKCFKFVMRSAQKLGCYSGFATVCSGCFSVYNKERLHTGSIQLQTRKTDGRTMLSDPHSNHLPGCIPFVYDDVIKKSPLVLDLVKEKIINGDDISMHLSPHGSPFTSHMAPITDFPVSIAMNLNNPVKPIFIHRLKDLPGKCYKFLCQGIRSLSGDYSTVCSGCRSAGHKEKKRSGSIKKTNGCHMFCDPSASHVPGCKPYDYEEVLLTTPLVSDVVREKLLRGEDISQFLPPCGSPFCKVDARKVAGGLQAESVAKTRTRKRTLEDTDDWNAPLAAFLQSLSSVDVPDRKDLVVNKCKRVSLADVLLPDDKPDVSSHLFVPNSRSHSIKSDESAEPVRRIQMSPRTTFKKKFDAFIFGEEEVDVTVVEGRLLRVHFERKTASLEEDRSSLLYEVKLPDHVDADSLTTSWKDGILIVRANSKVPIS